jgi:hypothetical protein
MIKRSASLDTADIIKIREFLVIIIIGYYYNCY